MRFKAGFVAGCAVGLWAASKTAQLRRVGVQPQSGAPRSVGSRAEAINAEVTAEKMRALGVLARHRLGDVLDGPIGAAARTKFTELVGLSMREILATTAAGPSPAGRRHSG